MDLRSALWTGSRWGQMVVLHESGTLFSHKDPGCLLTIKLDFPIRGRIGLPAVELQKALAGLRTVDQLEPSGNGITLFGEGGTARIEPAWKPDRVELQNIDAIEGGNWSKLKPAERGGLERAFELTAAGAKSGRPALAWVVTGPLGAFASDEIRNAHVSVVLPEAAVPGGLFDDLGPGLLEVAGLGAGAIAFRVGDEVRAFVPDNIRIPPMPDYPRLFGGVKAVPRAPVGIDPRELTKAVRAASKSAPARHIGLSFETGAVWATIAGVRFHVSAHSWARGQILLDYGRLIAALRGRSGETILWIGGPTDPVEILEPPYRELLFPVVETPE